MPGQTSVSGPGVALSCAWLCGTPFFKEKLAWCTTQFIKDLLGTDQTSTVWPPPPLPLKMQPRQASPLSEPDRQISTMQRNPVDLSVCVCLCVQFLVDPDVLVAGVDGVGRRRLRPVASGGHHGRGRLLHRLRPQRWIGPAGRIAAAPLRFVTSLLTGVWLGRRRRFTTVPVGRAFQQRRRNDPFNDGLAEGVRAGTRQTRIEEQETVEAASVSVCVCLVSQCVKHTGSQTFHGSLPELLLWSQPITTRVISFSVFGVSCPFKLFDGVFTNP